MVFTKVYSTINIVGYRGSVGHTSNDGTYFLWEVWVPGPVMAILLTDHSTLLLSRRADHSDATDEFVPVESPRNTVPSHPPAFKTGPSPISQESFTLPPHFFGFVRGSPPLAHDRISVLWTCAPEGKRKWKNTKAEWENPNISPATYQLAMTTGFRATRSKWYEADLS
ncbi:hypothetical protein AVEN_185055-1 [Araneus ventricosus]|uniref:Uncharacterized protein n=1 Tax=Araneus ventricosus TaxID=182803 RepID=A0A4Y2BQX3_ARAVE|nr:hypothetical protein AVEN_185055-1 [Araneus ventricosus]